MIYQGLKSLLFVRNGNLTYLTLGMNNFRMNYVILILTSVKLITILFGISL